MIFQIPLSETTLDEEEVEAATRVLRSKWLTMGEEVAAFEQEFAAALGARHAIAVNNGTAALEMAIAALNLEPGSEVLLPSITFVACLNAVRRLGLKPVLVDVASEDDWTISIPDLLQRLSRNSRLIISMPHGGFCPDMEGLVAICEEHGTYLLEDACHAPLASFGGTPIGSFGYAGTWSFFGNKNMTTGEGGMITSNSESLAAEFRLMRSHGITRSTWDRARGHASRYDVAMAGTNERMDEVRAAIGRVQLRKLPAATEARARAATLLRQALDARQIPGLKIPYRQPRGVPAHHLFCVLLPEFSDRDAIMESMKGDGIQTSVHYPPLDSFQSTRELFAGAPGLPVTRRIENRILTLPLFPGLSEDQCQRIAEALARAISGSKPG